MSALSEDTTVPTLDSWITLSEAAKIIGVTRQHAYRLATNKTFPSLHRFGTPVQYVIKREDAENYRTAQTTRTEE